MKKQTQARTKKEHKLLTEHLSIRRAIAEFVIAIGIVLTASVISLSTTFAWGPERQTFTLEQPATSPTFNSITNNPVIGDERNFVRIREAGAGQFTDAVQVQPGRNYEVYIFFHNNASAIFNTDAARSGIAVNTRMRSSFPSRLSAGSRGTVIGEITSGTLLDGVWTNSNVNPPRVWDEAFIYTDYDVRISFIPASARIFNNGNLNNSLMSTDLFSSTGTFIGYNNFDGLLPGCTQYAGYVIYQIRVEAPDFTVNKQASRNGGDFQNQITALPGDTISFRIDYANTGTTTQNNVLVTDRLPDRISYVTGTSTLVNFNNPDGRSVNDNLFAAGINIGNYASGATARLQYDARIADEEHFECGWTTLENTANVHTGDGDMANSANIRVYRDCNEEPETPDTPEEEPTIPYLPETGPVEIVGAIVGMSMIVVAATYYIKSRSLLQKP